MENANKAVKEAVEYVKKVIKDNPQLLDLYPNLNNEMEYIGHNRAKLMKVIHETRHLRILLDLTSEPIRKICINKGDALVVSIEKSSFTIGYDLKPVIDDPNNTNEQLDEIHVLEVHNIHETMFLCFSGLIRDERAFLTEAWKKNKEHMNVHGINMSVEVMSDNLGKFWFDHYRLDPRCAMIVAGFDDKNETQVYRIDTVEHTQIRSQYATIGRRRSDLHNVCSATFRRTMGHDKIIEALSKSLIVALAEPGCRMHFRGFLYYVTPEKTKGRRLIGKEEYHSL